MVAVPSVSVASRSPSPLRMFLRASGTLPQQDPACGGNSRRPPAARDLAVTRNSPDDVGGERLSERASVTTPVELILRIVQTVKQSYGLSPFHHVSFAYAVVGMIR